MCGSTQLAEGFDRLGAYRTKLNEFRHSQTVLAPLAYFPASHDRAGVAIPPAVDELKSGLLALISQAHIREFPEEKLRLLYLRGSQFTNQFLAADNHHSDEFFQLLAGLRSQMNKSLANSRKRWWRAPPAALDTRVTRLSSSRKRS